jgi:hypothetical protein
MIFSPGLKISTNGVDCGISDRDTPGKFTDWQKYCIAGALRNVNRNLFDWKKFVLSGVLLSAVICVFISKKKRDRSPSFKYHS